MPFTSAIRNAAGSAVTVASWHSLMTLAQVGSNAAWARTALLTTFTSSAKIAVSRSAAAAYSKLQTLAVHGRRRISFLPPILAAALPSFTACASMARSEVGWSDQPAVETLSLIVSWQ